MKLQLPKGLFFQDKRIPDKTSLIGLSALVHALDVKAPVRKPGCVSSLRTKETKKEQGEWVVFDSKYAVANTVEANLVFAIKNEPIDLLVLKRIFLAVPEQTIVNHIKASPTGPVSRRLWFLFEFLTGKKLKVPDSGKVANVDLLDPKEYFVAAGDVSVRHRVRNNLLGTKEFCPIVRRTKTLTQFVEKKLSERAQLIVSKVSPTLVARAASFLLLADTKASFAIENERLPMNIRERWLKAVQQVGRYPLDENELNRLHAILIGDFRFTMPGLRKDNVFLGKRIDDFEPAPDFIGAKPEDLEDLIGGLEEANNRMNAAEIDAVVQATAIAFGFVYVHPFEDGNGRLQRCLIHHVLAARRFSPPGLVFPVSSVMLKLIDEYRAVLEAHSKPLMDYIEWIPSEKGNVDVRNDTIDFYRFFDCTDSAEFLYKCVEATLIEDVPKEIDYLKRHDRAMKVLMDTVEMPNRMAEDFIMFMRQNEWKLPKRRRQDEFKKLTDEEIIKLERLVQSVFG